MTLEQLSAAATQGEWRIHGAMLGYRGDLFSPTAKQVTDCHHIARFYAPKPDKPINCDLQSIGVQREAVQQIEANVAFVAALVNAYRTGQLVAVTDDAIERVARTLAPNLEGGREFDQMPKDRAQLRQWTAQGMCLINDATQDDATWLAQEAIKAAKGTGDE